jgi:hypothetical protein
MSRIVYISLVAFFLLIYCCAKDDPATPEPEDKGPVAVDKSNPMKIYVHYMPWFETPETNNGNWGQHWTMSTRNPELKDENEIREIASYYYPTIGPYASSDKDVIEYHLLLMKYAGVDGLIIDWYGSHEVYDFPANKINSEAVIDMLDDVGLSFALTYEDWTLNSIVDQGAASTVVDAAIADIDYIENNYFSLDSYIDINGDPLLTVFGPQVLQNSAEWTEVLAGISETPVLLSLWYESGDLGSNGSGEFAWVYEDNTHCENFYRNRVANLDLAIGGAYPGYKDYYLEGGWGDGQGWTIDHNNGATLDATLKMAQDAEIDHMQIITWNDFGEGTMIEPTLEFGFTYLEKLQTFSGTPYTSDEFEYILKQFQLRKSTSDISSSQNALDRSFIHFVKLETEEAKAIIDSLDQIY